MATTWSWRALEGESDAAVGAAEAAAPRAPGGVARTSHDDVPSNSDKVIDTSRCAGESGGSAPRWPHIVDGHVLNRQVELVLPCCSVPDAAGGERASAGGDTDAYGGAGGRERDGARRGPVVWRRGGGVDAALAAALTGRWAAATLRLESLLEPRYLERVVRDGNRLTATTVCVAAGGCSAAIFPVSCDGPEAQRALGHDARRRVREAAGGDVPAQTTLLRLVVDVETYRLLGLEGRRSHAGDKGGRQRRRRRGRSELEAAAWVIDVDIGRDGFAPGDATYDRVLWCVRERVTACRWLLAWSAPGEASDVPLPDDAVDAVQHDAVSEAAEYAAEGIEVPLLKRRAPGDVLLAAPTLHAWLGGVACRAAGLLSREEAEPYLSAFPSPHEGDESLSWTTSSVACRRWRGLLRPAFARSVLDEARAHVARGDGPWAAVLVWGFPGAAVSWTSSTSSAWPGDEAGGDTHYWVVVHGQGRESVAAVSVGAGDGAQVG